MCFKTTKWASEQQCDNAAQKLVLILLAVYKNSTTGQCDPGHAQLAERCCLSQSSLKSHLRALVQAGKIKIIVKVVNGGNVANQYDLRMPKNYPFSEPETAANVLPFSGKTGGGADSAPKYINKHTSLSLLPDGFEEIYHWAQQHSFWGNIIDSEQKFLDLYASQKPNGLRAQYEAQQHASTTQDRRHAHQPDHYHGSNRRRLTPAEQVASAAGFSFD